MMKIRTLVIDDEKHAVNRIVRLLTGDNDFEVVGTGSTIWEAQQLLSEHEADLIFLDIEMPGGTGIQFMGSLAEDKRPQVVFVTAYSEYAVQAFEYFALDYLLKPFSNQRFLKTLSRIKRTIHTLSAPPVNWNQLEQIAIHHQLPHGKLVVKTGKKYEFVPYGEIAYIVADGVYASIHCKDGRRLLYRETITHLEEMLKNFGFTRIHHSTIVQNSEVKGIVRINFGNIEALMKDNTSLRVSRKYKNEVKGFLKQSPFVS